ncbi:relaxase/mobilization nuclease domain-containing protein [Methylophaga thalassica]|uniref:relaxase/mobilization nuclease domain-containing protein n=1 Tax=Methylophaga thalassica TaxID=40223 RepID=UPI00360A0742
MAKITGFSKGTGHIASHIEYIAREGEEVLENDKGELFKGRENLESAYSDWIKDIESFPKEKSSKTSRDVMHLMLSMPAGTDPEKVRDAARNFAKKAFSENHEYLFALHTDQPHPHVHLAVKMLGFNNKKLDPKKMIFKHGVKVLLKNLERWALLHWLPVDRLGGREESDERRCLADQ